MDEAAYNTPPLAARAVSRATRGSVVPAASSHSSIAWRATASTSSHDRRHSDDLPDTSPTTGQPASISRADLAGSGQPHGSMTTVGTRARSALNRRLRPTRPNTTATSGRCVSRNPSCPNRWWAVEIAWAGRLPDVGSEMSGHPSLAAMKSPMAPSTPSDHASAGAPTLPSTTMPRSVPTTQSGRSTRPTSGVR